MALEIPSATGALAFHASEGFTFTRVVLARTSNRREILPASFLRRGRNPDRTFFVVRGDHAIDRNIELDADSFDHCGYWSVRSASRETRVLLSLVASCDDSLYRHSGLWQSPSLVSAPARPDRSRVCRRSLRIGRIENLCLARFGDYLVNLGCEFVLGSSPRLRGTPLS